MPLRLPLPSTLPGKSTQAIPDPESDELSHSPCPSVSSVAEFYRANAARFIDVVTFCRGRDRMQIVLGLRQVISRSEFKRCCYPGVIFRFSLGATQSTDVRLSRLGHLGLTIPVSRHCLRLGFDWRCVLIGTHQHVLLVLQSPVACLV